MTMSQNGDAEIKAAPDEYAAFISQIELRDIWLVEATVQNHVGPDTPREGILQVEHDPTWLEIDHGFRAMSRYNASVVSENIPIAEIAITFAVDFDSPDSMTDPLFALFGPINLPLNTWPYLREFISTSFSRMNWHPFSIPALKRGIPPTEKNSSATPPDENPLSTAVSSGDSNPTDAD